MAGGRLEDNVGKEIIDYKTGKSMNFNKSFFLDPMNFYIFNQYIPYFLVAVHHTFFR